MKISALKELEKLDIAIEASKPKDKRILDEMANNITVGVYDYPAYITAAEKVTFALSRLGKANVKEIVKYLGILGERGSQKEIKEMVDSVVTKLSKDHVFLEDKTEKKYLYSLNKEKK